MNILVYHVRGNNFLYYALSTFFTQGFSSLLERWGYKGVRFFYSYIRYETRCTWSSRQTTTTNCAQGQGSSLTLPLFEPSWKKSVMISRDIKLFFCRLLLASTLHPQMTCPRDAKNKGHIIVCKTTGEETQPSILHVVYW